MRQKPFKDMTHTCLLVSFHFRSDEFSKQSHPRGPEVRIVATYAGIHKPSNQTAM